MRNERDKGEGREKTTEQGRDVRGCEKGWMPIPDLTGWDTNHHKEGVRDTPSAKVVQKPSETHLLRKWCKEGVRDTSSAKVVQREGERHRVNEKTTD